MTGDRKKVTTMDIKHTVDKQVQTAPTGSANVQTSRTNPELAERIRQSSARIMKQNYQLYKDLENK